MATPGHNERRTARSHRRLDAAERRNQLIESAGAVFARRGYAGTGTRDLATAAGVSEPILYRHFDGKAGLFQAVLERAETRLVAAVSEAAAGIHGAAARLSALAEALPGILESCRDDLRVLNAAALAHEEPEILAAAARSSRGVGMALAQLFRGSGLRRDIDSKTAGFLLLEVGMGAAMLSPLDVPEVEGKRYRNRVVRGLVRGIAGGAER